MATTPHFPRGGAVGLALLLALAGCEVAVTPPPANPQLCPEIYQPVCARTDGGQRTFPNACVAQASGYTAYSPGECPPAADRVCPMIYAPVCAVRSGRQQTYSNECFAGAAGAQVIRRGPC